MTNQSTYDWDSNNILDDVDFSEEDSKEFKRLLGIREASAAEGSIALMNAGQILKGKIIEISKDFVVVDVGLKSEGLVPVSEFTDPEELKLDNEVEVLLDKTEGSDGQIVLSKEKARKLRQWEYILNYCKEGSVITGKVIRKVKGG
jgi:small subunit ribosomal protein S1